METDIGQTNCFLLSKCQSNSKNLLNEHVIGLSTCYMLETWHPLKLQVPYREDQKKLVWQSLPSGYLSDPSIPLPHQKRLSFGRGKLEGALCSEIHINLKKKKRKKKKTPRRITSERQIFHDVYKINFINTAPNELAARLGLTSEIGNISVRCARSCGV